MLERLANLAVMARWRGVRSEVSGIVQQRLHVFDGCREGQRRDRRAAAIERQHVVATRGRSRNTKTLRRPSARRAIRSYPAQRRKQAR